MKNNETIVIESTSIKKSLTFKKSRLRGFTYENKLSGDILSSCGDSEDFILSFKWGFFGKRNINSSELTLSKYTKEGSTHVFIYEPFAVADSSLSLRAVYFLPNTGSVIKKHLELSYEQRGSKDIILDCIDNERLLFEGDIPNWSIPDQASSHISGQTLELGQPVYVGSLFFGVEFPVSYNKVENGGTTLRTYSGKPLRELIGKGTYKGRECVVGAAQGDSEAQLQRALFTYIMGIACSGSLRRQYNSWYDHKLDITAENLTESFLEIEKALTRVGEKPLDSYVSDDGWNDYTKGFWSFNSNFPNELYPMRELCSSLGSHFGLWLGPRGGYTSDTPKFAKRIQAAGNGYYNKQAYDICVASKKYSDKTGELLLDFQDRFNLNYWKLDGFAQAACKNKKHDHIVGGFRNMYFYTEVWDRWFAVFDRLYDRRKDLWINLTCYAWPSPWFLMHANSLWMQVSDDHGFIGKKGETADKDRVLTYRDDRYHDFCRERQFQFPLSRLYNHDPIYANEAGFTMSDSEFRDYLFVNAMRGTAFWELYYSYDLMNEAKWRINYSALRFSESNREALYSPVIFGAKPSEGKVYGFSCFSECRGIIAFRNSGAHEQEYIFRLDERVGVPRDFGGRVTPILPYKGESMSDFLSFGDTFKVVLAPYQTKIFYLGIPEGDISERGLKVVSENEIEVTFSQLITAEGILCKSLPIIKTELLPDFMTLRITFDGAFGRENTLTLENVTDIFGRQTDISVTFGYCKDYISCDGVSGKYDFTVKATPDGEKACVLYSQGDDIRLSIDEDGYISFKLGETLLRSVSTAHDVVQIAAVRERNGVMKLYLNGRLNSGCVGNQTSITLQKGKAFDENRVVIYSRALAYDEV